MLKIVDAENLYLTQLHIKITFLRGDLEEEIYMTQPEGFIEVGKENLVIHTVESTWESRVARKMTPGRLAKTWPYGDGGKTSGGCYACSLG